jgi:hypothetical protein
MNSFDNFLYFHDYLLSLRVCLDTGNNGSKDEKELLDLVISDKSINVNEIPNDAKKGHDVTAFNYKYIMAATNNFSLESKLGEGGFGPVYMVSSKTFLKKDV